MSSVIRKALAFIKRDFRIESGYKTSFLMRAVESILTLVFFYFLSQLLGRQGTGSALGKYSQSYLPFAVIGVAFARYFDLTLRMFSESIRLVQVTGCLEAMLSSQTGCVPVVLMSSLFSLISGAVQLLIILIAAAVAFGVDFSHMDVPATLLIVFLSIAVFVSFGVLSAAMVVWLKKGDPITWLLSGAGAIMGGAYFPIEVMPHWMQKIAFLLPITYSLDALRLAMLRGYSVSSMSRSIGILAAMTVFLVPATLFLFSAVVQKGRKEGTLIEY
jgi:ABC-2 type transport system permease protein